MPVFTAEVPETHLRINRPVIKQVVDDVLKTFKDLPFKEFRFLGDAEQLQTPGSAIDSGAFNRELAGNYIDIEVDDVPDDEFGRSYATSQAINHNIISCKRTRLDMYPIYQNRKIVIRMKIVGSSRVRVNGLITRIKQGMYQSATLFTHKISYDYDLPKPCVALLNEMYHLMENKHGYGIEFVDWLREIRQDHITLSTRLDGKVAVLCVQENGVNVLSNLVEHADEPTKDRENNNGVWSIDLDIELRYQRPNVIRASYPPLVHNQLLNDIWFNTKGPYNYRKEAASTSLGARALERFKWDLNYGYPTRGGLGVKEPYFDDWGKIHDNKKLVKLLTALVSIDEQDYRQFYNLKTDMDEFRFPETFMDTLTRYPDALLYEGKHLVCVKAYNDSQVIRPEHLVIDNLFNIRMDYDLNPRGYYHIVFFLNADPTTIPIEVWNTLLCSKEALILYFELFGDKYADKLREINKNIEDACFTMGHIDSVLKDLVEDNNGAYENGKLYKDYSPRRTKLVYGVSGEKNA